MKIYLGGLTSSKPGGMEFHNLGNFIITEPLFQLLKLEFENCEIITSMQMSDSFISRFGARKLVHRRFWEYNKYTILRSLCDLTKVLIYKFFSVIGIRLGFILNSSLFLKEIKDIDLFIDFSGDLYGDNAKALMLIEASLELIIARLYGVKTAILIGSPGPFNQHWKRMLVRYVFNNADLVTNRESISTELLIAQKFKSSHMHSTACPSIFFDKDTSEKSKMYLTEEKLLKEGTQTKIGLIICGWNMPVGPHNKWPREKSEFDFFNELIQYLTGNYNAQVYLMSHQNATDEKMKLLPGKDHELIRKLYDINRHLGDNLNIISGLYTASESKTIIGEFDMLISGRIHGAVQGMSQLVPTMIIDYGHEPKAHKLKGFAKNYGIEEYVINPNNISEAKIKVSKFIDNNNVVKAELRKHIVLVKEKVMTNFELLRELLNST